MKQVTIPVKVENKLNIRASDDLSVEGLEGAVMVAVVRQSDSFKYTETAGKTEVKVTSDCRLQLPSSVPLTVEKVGGDATMMNLTSRVIVGKIGGDLVIRNLPGASIEAVGGDLHINLVGGGMEVVRVGGDLYGSEIQSLSARAIGGDVYLRRVTGEINLTAGGDIQLELSTSDLPAINITAGGDIQLIVPTTANGQLAMTSKGNTISVHVGEQVGDWEVEQLDLPLGEAKNLVKLTAAGDITVSDQEIIEHDFDTVFENSATEWQSFGADLEKQIRESIGSAMEGVHWATQSAAFAGEKARAKVEKAMRKLDAKGVVIDHTGVNVERDGKHVGITFGTPVVKTEKRSSGPSDEERLLVLKMLQDKKITAEEADKLLSALDK